MLVLTRKIDEGIVIGGNITIKVVAIEGNKVKLGIIAGKDVPIIREEIIEAVKNENISAGNINFSNFDIGIVLSEEGKKERGDR